MKNTCQKGNVVEAKLLAKLVELGYLVFLPYGEGHKADLIFVDTSGQLQRVQIKKSRPTTVKDTFTFNLYSNGGGYNKISYTVKDIDYFGTEFEGDCYLIPIKDIVNSKTLTLRKGNSYKI